MNVPVEKLRDLTSHARWDAAINLVRQYDAASAAEGMMALPFEDQRELYRKIPQDYAATLVGCFPYFHAYVLLYSRPPAEMHKIV